MSRPLKINPTLAKLEQIKAYLKKVLPNHAEDCSSKPPSVSSTPLSSPTKAFPRASLCRTDPHGQASSLDKSGSLGALPLTFHRVSLQTAQIVTVMETGAHPSRPSMTLALSSMMANLHVKSGLRAEGKREVFGFILLLLCSIRAFSLSPLFVSCLYQKPTCKV